jgi:Tfp pilus assembly protein PilV
VVFPKLIKMKKNLQSNKGGLALVEAMVASAVSLGIILALVGTASIVGRLSQGSVERVQAAFLIEEGLEAIRIIRDNGWSNNIALVPRDTPLYLHFDGTTWQATTTPFYIDGRFERVFLLSNVYRGADSSIVEAGGTLDPQVVKATVIVSWAMARGATTTKQVSTYFTNIFSN